MTEEQLELGLQVSDPQSLRDSWCAKLKGYQKEYERWTKRCEKIVDRYRNEQATTGDESMRLRRYALLWSNIQTLGPAIYCRGPKPEVTRRYYDKDPTARLASAVLERALQYEMDVTGFHAECLNCRDDYLLAGRGTLWQRYEPIIEDVAEDSDGEAGDPELPSTDEVNSDGGQAQPGVEALGANGGPPMQRVIGENAPTDYVHWKDFMHGPAQTWKQVPWVARKVLMDKASVDARWPAAPDQPPLSTILSFTHKQEKDDEKKKSSSFIGNLALIYEIWDKVNFKAIWYSEDLKTSVIEEIDDPLKLDDFFPCPPPLYATMTTDTLEPVPDYIMYRDQASEIDILTQRITLLMKALAVRGVYDSSNAKLSDLLNERPENFMLPVDNWAAFAEKGGFQGTTSFVPIQQIAEVVQGLQAARTQFINDVYQITGISDIVRGQGDPDDTATAQQLKGQFANMRLNARRDAIAEFVRNALRIKAQVMAEHFDQSTLRQISGFDQMTEVVAATQQGGNADALWMQVYALLKNDPMRLTKLDVETNSMVQADQAAEQQSRTMFLEAVGKFLQQALTAVNEAPAMAPLLGQMLAFGVRGFNIGRELEGVIDQAIDQINKMAANPQPKPPPPEVIKAQAEVARAQADAQSKQSADQLAMVKQQQDADQQRHEFDENIRLQILELVLKYGALTVAQAAQAIPPMDRSLNAA